MATAKRPKAAEGSKAARPETRKVKITIKLTTLRRLKVEGLGRGDLPLGQVIDDLVESQPVRFVLTERGKGQANPGDQGQGPPALGLLDVG